MPAPAIVIAGDARRQLTAGPLASLDNPEES